MSIHDVIVKLERAQEPSRSLDFAIGMLLGWERKPTLDGNMGWVSPVSGTFAKVPAYTSLIDKAVEFTQEICDGEQFGISFAHGQYSASVGDGVVAHGPTPAIALCLSALRCKATR